MQYEAEVNGRVRQVTINRVDGRFLVSLDGEEWLVDAARIDPQTLSLLVEDRGRHGSSGPTRAAASSAAEHMVTSHEVTLTTDQAPGQVAVTVGAVPVTVTLNGRRRWSRTDDGAKGTGGPQRLLAPMPGRIVRVLVTVGQTVQQRQPLVVVEAMKMENELRATGDGVVAELPAREGQSVDAGTLLVVLVPA
jgi:biotin carboxyl carrier protein